ncbi:D-serine ammonia-lyase [Halocynthiibacter styelae]|uniref:Probable D-serine dehydratase n=1 Tax=Halocynthiibacter styelae TaxID=2761955 RepID=A0A8J7LLC0_9RHOB|nr:D-serine ammonia-lyase [Paenihalocynthiibacter styelae]MBI1494394.1 D-serine ammonia-lyase [Paenihalocynthiibacter styelae]
MIDAQLKSRLQKGTPLLWVNPDQIPVLMAEVPVRPAQVKDAEQNWRDLAPLLQQCFPELQGPNGAISSDLIEVATLAQVMGNDQGRHFVKGDHALPVAGSVKARGGIYEVFLYALSLARDLGLIKADDTPMALAHPDVKAAFANYTVAVGSTGNLGLSVGIAARALGFRAVVHMSSDAKAWKVERLQRHGVDVVQHDADYGSAVAAARDQADADPKTYFVDDERSELLFFGYSAAAAELRDQLRAQNIQVDAEHPLFVYLPCGIGGAPGGVAYGLKQVFGDHAHCFFTEPAQSPCALVQLAAGLTKQVNVYDIGLTNKTEADGMAVAEISWFIAQVMHPLLSGVYTVDDNDLFRWLALAHDHAGLQLEPSAAACLAGPGVINSTPEGQGYLTAHHLQNHMPNATHVMWTTGGSFVPDAEFQDFLSKGKTLL